MLHKMLRAAAGNSVETGITLVTSFGFTTTSESYPVSLEQDDFCIMVLIQGSGSTTPSGWTLGSPLAGANQLAWWYRKQGATPDTTVTVPVAGAAVVHVYRNVHASSPFSGTQPTWNAGNNPPAITTAHEGAIHAVSSAAVNDNFTAGPAGYDNFFETGNGSFGVAAASLLGTAAGTYDPGAFTGGGGTNSGSDTIGLRLVGT